MTNSSDTSVGILTDALFRDTDLDILGFYRSLPSQRARASALLSIAAFCAQAHLPLKTHRSLVVLSALLSIFGRDCDARLLTSTLRRCQLVFACDPEHQSLDSPADFLGRYRENVRSKASEILLRAVAEHCKPASARSLFPPRAVRRRAIASAPVRLDLGAGGISDIPPYCLERFGTCVNLPIILDGRRPIFAATQLVAVRRVEFQAGRDQPVRTFQELAALDRDDLGSLHLLAKTLRFFMTFILGADDLHLLYDALGGHGLRLTVHCTLGTGTGLGVSSLVTCSILLVLARLFAVEFDPDYLIRASMYLEASAGIGGGWEDSTAMIRGLKLMQGDPFVSNAPRALPIRMSGAARHQLAERLVLVHSGIDRIGQINFAHILERYSLRDPSLLRAVSINNSLNLQAAANLTEGNLSALGATITSQWENWKDMTENRCTHPEIDDLFATTADFVDGARLNGAGGGGIAMFLVRKGCRARFLRMVRRILGARTTVYGWQGLWN